MKRFCRVFAISVLCALFISPICPAADTSPAEQKYLADLSKLAEAHSAAVKTARRGFIEALKEEMKEETKKGNLDGAVAIRDRIQRLEAIKDGNVIADLANSSWLDTLSTVYKFHDDGTFSTNAGAENKKDAKLRRSAAPVFTVGSDTVVIAAWNRCYDILIFDEERKEFSRHHFQFDKNTPPFSTGRRVPSALAE